TRGGFPATAAENRAPAPDISVAGTGEVWPFWPGTGPLRLSTISSIRLKQRGFSMQSRFVAVPLVLMLLCAGTAAQAQYLGDPDGRYSGGQLSTKRYEFLGGMSYVGAIRRETVS